eukprot:2990853-Alexandrium_andersonii.AAC.1
MRQACGMLRAVQSELLASGIAFSLYCAVVWHDAVHSPYSPCSPGMPLAHSTPSDARGPARIPRK